ncbi:MAG: ABC transporter permease [Chloroflexota bacterium]|nr:ABC transporter permease [Chloroflexota bacterium]
MRVYILRRLLLAIPTLFGVTVLIFLAMRVIPGDPLAMMEASEGATIVLSEAELATARASLGLDQPYHVQYLDWMGQVLRGDLGESFWRGDKVRDLVLRRGPITLEIAMMTVVVAWVIGIPIGIVSAVKQRSWLDYVTRLGVILFLAVPSFWLAMLAITGSVLAFSWRPPLDLVQINEDPGRHLQIVAGPILVLGIGLAAVIARFTRSAMLEVLQDDFVRTARAKGLSASTVNLRHALRNALLPIITVSGLAFGGLLGGSVAVERAFGVPGLGAALVLALNERDWMVIQNLVLLYGVIFVVVNLVVDISYGLVDPRIRYQ